jgi:ribonuclease BN (tRNA processing enzyme)
MKLTILGQYGPYPKAGGACSGYLVSNDSGSTNIAVDMGPGVLGRLFEWVSVEDLTAVVLTHLHFDHISDILAMQYALQFSGRSSLPVYAPSQPAPVRALLEGGKFSVLPHEDGMIGDIAVSFSPAAHPVPGSSVAFSQSGRRIVCTGDTNMHDALIPFCEGADLLLADAGLPKQAWTPKAPHLSAELCGSVAAQARVKRLVLTHFSPRFSEEAILDEAKAVFPETTPARPGETYAV